MYAQVEKTKGNKGREVASSVAQKKINSKKSIGLVDNRTEAIAQRKQKEVSSNRPRNRILKGIVNLDNNAASQQPIQLAGHEGAIVKTEKGIKKKTSTAEAEVYEEYQNRLDVIPSFYGKSTEDDTTKIEIEDLFKGIDNPVKFDIKIGKVTSSYNEIYKTKTAYEARKKKIKMDISDKATGSSERGWRLIPQDDSNRLSTGRNSKKNIISELKLVERDRYKARQIIVNGIQKIIYQTYRENITFIAASVLIVIDPKNPTNSKIKLIDLAHPVRPNEHGYKKYQKNFLSGLNSLKVFFDQKHVLG